MPIAHCSLFFKKNLDVNTIKGFWKMSRTVSTLHCVNAIFDKVNLCLYCWALPVSETQCIQCILKLNIFCSRYIVVVSALVALYDSAVTSGWTIVPDLVVMFLKERLDKCTVESYCYRTCKLILPRLKEYLFESLGDIFLRCAELIKLNL